VLGVDRLGRPTARASSSEAPSPSCRCPPGSGKPQRPPGSSAGTLKPEGYGAWASAAVFDDSYIPEQALDRLLAMAEPGVGNDDLAAQAISLTTPSSGFVLVIDDVTHCRQPDQKLRSLLNWASTRSSGAATSLRVLCPVPTSVLQSVFFEPNSVLANYIIEGQFTADDAQRAVRRRIQQVLGQSSSALQVREIAEDLGNDPLLIGLAFADGTSVRSGADVIPQFLQANLKRCADSTQTEQLSDLWESLLGLGRQMLIHKDVEPFWADVRLWLKDRDVGNRPSRPTAKAAEGSCRARSARDAGTTGVPPRPRPSVAARAGGLSNARRGNAAD
jgi:hypothetical protein